MFSLRKFKSPPAVNAPGYFWFLNDNLEEDELRRQIRGMAAGGARTVCPHPLPPEFRDYFMSGMAPGFYLTPAYFEKYRVIADECARLGMNCYLYDEGGWPSGGACGQVYAADPERFAQRYLTLTEDGEHYRIAVREFPEGKAKSPNLLMREVTDKFLELTHEQYARYIGRHFGKVFKFVFMDEPATPPCAHDRLPWTWDFFEEFRKRKGYDVEPLVVPILKSSLRPAAVQAKIDYLDVVSQLFTERFLRPVKEWCRAHGLLSGGHMSGEDSWGNTMYHDHGALTLRALRELDFPGVDVIWRQLWPGLRLHPFPKMASSVARQNGNKYVSGEMFGVYGNGLTPGQMKFLIDYMILCGVNTFITCVHPYSTRGGAIEGERPHFGKCNPLWRHLKPYHDYVSRLSELAADSRPAAGTALFFDTISLRCLLTAGAAAAEQEKIAYRLLEAQCDFDYVDDDVLTTAVMRGGKLRVGKAEYDRLVLPEKCRMTPAAEANLEKLRAKGLEVLRSDESDRCEPTLNVEPPDWRLRVCKTAAGGGNYIYFILNTGSVPVTRRFSALEKASVARCDAETGRLFTVPHTPGCWEWRFEPLASAAFLVGPGAEKAEPAPPCPGETVRNLRGPWELRPLRRTRVGKNDFETEEIADAPRRKVALGDWAASLGADFSGEAVYRKRFFVPETAGIDFLDLGKVCCVAEVRLNGLFLGKRLWAPYVFELGRALKKGFNDLEITVVNTLANAMAPDEIYERWKRELPFMISYEERQRIFELEGLDSGLVGPVRLRKTLGK